MWSNPVLFPQKPRRGTTGHIPDKPPATKEGWRAQAGSNRQSDRCGLAQGQAVRTHEKDQEIFSCSSGGGKGVTQLELIV